MERLCYENYQTLERIGGIPSREIECSPDPCSPSRPAIDHRYHARDHIGREVQRTEEELETWLRFRWHQVMRRESPQANEEYTRIVRTYEQRQGHHEAVELSLSRQKRLDEWREYYIFEDRKRINYQMESERAIRSLKLLQERVKNGQHCNTTSVTSTTLPEQWGEPVSYDDQITEAHEQVHLANKKVATSRAQASLSAVAREILVSQAEEDLQSAQNHLKALESKIAELKEEVRAANEIRALTRAQRRVEHATTRLGQSKTLTKWIAEQIAGTALLLGKQGGQTVLDGWTEYYILLCSWLTSGQAPVKLNPWIGRIHADEPEKRLQVVLSWIRQELPHVAHNDAVSDVLPAQDCIHPGTYAHPSIKRATTDVASE